MLYLISFPSKDGMLRKVGNLLRASFIHDHYMTCHLNVHPSCDFSPANFYFHSIHPFLKCLKNRFLQNMGCECHLLCMNVLRNWVYHSCYFFHISYSICHAFTMFYKYVTYLEIYCSHIFHVFHSRHTKNITSVCQHGLQRRQDLLIWKF